MKEPLFTEEEIDFISEAMNIGGGNAATALSQMLRCRVELKIPEIHIIPLQKTPSVIGEPTLPVVCTRMKMVGDVKGDLFYIIPEAEKNLIAGIARDAVPLPMQTGRENDFGVSIISEIGNIIAGAYTAALYDFCGLRIYHTVPDTAADMLQSLMEEALARASLVSSSAILIENEIEIGEEMLGTYFVIIPEPDSVGTLACALKKARKAYGG